MGSAIGGVCRRIGAGYLRNGLRDVESGRSGGKDADPRRGTESIAGRESKVEGERDGGESEMNSQWMEWMDKWMSG